MSAASDTAAHTSAAAPLVPADVNPRDFPYMPLDVVRLFGSTFDATCSDTEWCVGVTSWCRSWHQVPAGSLPDDDGQLALSSERQASRRMKQVA